MMCISRPCLLHTQLLGLHIHQLVYTNVCMPNEQCTYTPRCTSLTSFSTQSYRLSHKRTSSDHIQTALYLHFPPPIHQSHFLYIHTTPKHHLYNIPLTPCTFMSEILYLPSLQPSFHAPTSRTTAPAGHNDY